MKILSGRFILELCAAVLFALTFKFALGNLIYTAQNHLRYAFWGYNVYPTTLNLIILFVSSFVLLRFFQICLRLFKWGR